MRHIERLARRPGGALALLVGFSAIARFMAARSFETPWIAPDESIYALLGRSLWRSGSLSLLGGETGFFSFVYPALIGAPLLVGDLELGVAVVQALQAVLMSTTAIVVYLWGRRSLGQGWALTAAALSLTPPGLAYSGLLMSEAAFYPVAVVALAVLAWLLERPTPGRQALFACALALALLTRLQAVALVPALYGAVGLRCAFARSVAPARMLGPLLVGIPLAGAALAGGFAVAGSWSDVLGSYAAAAGGYELGPAAEDVLWHAAGVFVVVAGIPLVAVAALTIECARGREVEPAVQALVATAVAWTTCVAVEVGVFASRWVGHIAERDLLTVAPPLFLALAVWGARGLPRPRPWTQLAALAVATPAVLLPVHRFAVPEAALDAFSFIPLRRLGEVTSALTLELLFPVCAGALVAAAVFMPRRARLVLPALVAAVLVGLSVISTREISRLSRLEREWVFDSGDPAWIDAVASAPVTFLQAVTPYSATLWKHVFWNRRIVAVAHVSGAASTAPLEAVSARFAGDGRLIGDPITTALVATPAEIELAGSLLAQAPRSTNLAGLSLWRADAPVRIRTLRSGFAPNGDVRGEARITVFACDDGNLELTLLGKRGTPVEILVDGIVRARPRVDADTLWTGSVAAPPDADGTTPCVFDLVSPGLVGSTRVEFVRS